MGSSGGGAEDVDMYISDASNDDLGDLATKVKSNGLSGWPDTAIGGQYYHSEAAWREVKQASISANSPLRNADMHHLRRISKEICNSVADRHSHFRPLPRIKSGSGSQGDPGRFEIYW